jgi:ribose transport system substrate-binding protein
MIAFARAGRTARALLLATAAAAVAAAAFATAASHSATTAGPLDGKKVGVQFCTDAHPFCAGWNKTFKASLQKLGAKVTILTDFFNPADQQKHMNQLIAQKPDLIVVAPADPNAFLPSLRRAKAAGIPVLNTIGPLTPEGNELVEASVLTDNAALGRYAVQNVVEGMRKAGHMKGNIIFITGTETQFIVQERVKAFNAAIKRYPQYKVVATEDGNWDQATTTKIAQQLLAKYRSQGGIQGAIGMADNQAVGIIQAAQQAGVDIGVKNKGLVVVGTNCLSVGIKAIQQGTQYGTGTQAPQLEAGAAAQAATRLLEGKPVPKTITVKEYRINQANVGRYSKLCTF